MICISTYSSSANIRQSQRKATMHQEIKQGVYVILGSIVLLGLSFIVYFGLFRIFEAILNPEGRFGFVMVLRIGYGIILVLLAFLNYRTKTVEWLKASIMSAGLGTFQIGLMVSLYETPILAYGVVFVTLSMTAYFLFRTQQKWFHYIPIGMSLLAIWLYI